MAQGRQIRSLVPFAGGATGNDIHRSHHCEATLTYSGSQTNGRQHLGVVNASLLGPDRWRRLDEHATGARLPADKRRNARLELVPVLTETDDGLAEAAEPSESIPPPGWRPPTKGRGIGRYVVIGVVIFVGLGLLGTVARGVPANVLPTVGRTAQATAGSTPESVAASVAPTASAAVDVPVPAPQGLAPDGPTVEAAVVRVIDGDTIVVAFGGTEYHVRYIGMDTPESVKPGTPVQPMALEASAANKALVDGKTVELEKDVSEVDRYGRLLRDVWVARDGVLVLVGLELVRTGYAQVSTYPPDVKYVEPLLEAQAAARAAAVGLWSSEPAATPLPIAGGGNCHPSYTPCLPIVDDLDCPDVKAMGKAPVTIKGPDVYRLDRDGDGLGCE